MYVRSSAVVLGVHCIYPFLWLAWFCQNEELDRPRWERGRVSMLCVGIDLVQCGKSPGGALYILFIFGEDSLKDALQ